MNDTLPMVGYQVRWEQKSYWRNPAAAVFTFAFPLLFLVIFTAINGNGTIDIEGGEVKFAQYYVPAIIAFGLISACYTNLAFTICIRRESGLLKRARGTPLSPVVYLAGIVGNVIVVAMILTALIIGLGITAYGVTFPGRYLALIVAIVTGAFCFSTAGIAISTFVPNEDAAPAIINFVLFPLLFISGTFGPVSSDSALGRIAVIFPVRHLVQAMVHVFNPFGGGTGIVASHTMIMIAWGVVCLAISLRRFRWEPRIKS
ncbi:MAG TPA: ABC transporter permease [Ilumatobacteraceae bacterium]|nr:ABC transporter permease [Ilumatobacteraceae bacterium]